MNLASFRPGLLGALALSLALSHCAKKQDVIVSSGEGKALGDQAIDADPIALLPGNAVGVYTLDAKALVASPFGARLVSIAKARSPLPDSSGFDPGRDLERELSFDEEGEFLNCAEACSLAAHTGIRLSFPV